MKKGLGIFLGVITLIGIGGFLAGKVSFSERTSSNPPAQAALPFLPNASFKVSGSIKSVDLSDPADSRLTVVSESGAEKTLSFSTETPIVLEGNPLPAAELKTGDVVDVDCGFDEGTQKTVVRKVNVIVRASSDETAQEPDLSDDPEFE